MSMNIMKRSASGIKLIPLETMLYDERTISIEGEINEKASMEFVKQLIELNRQDSYEPIKVLICSGGGSVVHGMAMYDMMCSSKAPIQTYCIGMAYSMAAVLFCAGTRRGMLEKSKLMLHEPLINSEMGGNASSIKSMSESLQETKKQVNAILCRHTGKTEEEMNEATSFDHYFSATEAVAFGLADEIVGMDSIL